MNIQKGFTLVELLVVIVIISILSSLVAVAVLGHTSDARIKAARSDIRTIESALTMYHLDNFRYPTTESGLRALAERDGALRSNKIYLKKMPIDPWGNEYGYESDGREIDIWSLGADGVPGGEGEDADIHWADL